MSRRFWMHFGIALTSLVCSLVVFSPGFDNGFWRDDFVFLENCIEAHRDPDVLTSRWVEPFNRPLAQMFFFMEFSAWGLDGGAYIATNTALHALNATLLFALFRIVLGSTVAGAAAILFALGFGFYGKAVLWAANVAELLATTFVLTTGLLASLAQRARTAAQRLVAMVAASLAFLAALLCKETAVMTIVMVGGLMWPHRRSLSSMIRKIGLLLLVATGYFVYQFIESTGIAMVIDQTKMWLGLPLRAMLLAAFMVLPVQAESGLASASGPLFQKIVALIDQTRPGFGIALLLASGCWFVLGAGAVRWLMASFWAFLLPYGLIELPGDWLDIRYAYLPALFFCGLAAYGFRGLWNAAPVAARMLLAVLLFGALFGNMLLVQRLETKYHGFGISTESQEALRRLEQKRVEQGIAVPAPPLDSLEVRPK